MSEPERLRPRPCRLRRGPLHEGPVDLLREPQPGTRPAVKPVAHYPKVRQVCLGSFPRLAVFRLLPVACLSIATRIDYPQTMLFPLPRPVFQDRIRFTYPCQGFTGGVVDEILAEIRKSKFVVADFTSCDECQACEQCKHIGARGGVYFEAGFALGLGKTVFLTCREDRAKAVHFDINHLNRIQWKTPEDLREQLTNSIEAVLGHSPMDRSADQTTNSRQPEHTETCS